MSTIQEIKDAIQRLSADELAALRAWFAEFDTDAWDRRIEEDVAAGRLDALAEEALSADWSRPEEDAAWAHLQSDE